MAWPHRFLETPLARRVGPESPGCHARQRLQYGPQHGLRYLGLRPGSATSHLQLPPSVVVRFISMTTIVMTALMSVCHGYLGVVFIFSDHFNCLKTIEDYLGGWPPFRCYTELLPVALHLPSLGFHHADLLQPLGVALESSSLKDVRFL